MKAVLYTKWTEKIVADGKFEFLNYLIGPK